MKLALVIYRIIYVVSLAVILASVAQGIRSAGFETVSVMLPTCLLASALAVAIVAALAFRRFTLSMLWIVTVILGVVFTWYGWYGPNAPFIQHEIHTFDPVAAASEANRFKMQGLVVHSIVLLWFVSLPIVRRLSRSSARLAP